MLSQSRTASVSNGMIDTHTWSRDVASDDVVSRRPRLLGLAYRMLGDYDEAEDVVQEAYLRWQETDQQSIRSPEAWLLTATPRLPLDRRRPVGNRRAHHTRPRASV